MVVFTITSTLTKTAVEILVPMDRVGGDLIVSYPANGASTKYYFIVALAI